MLVVMVVQNVQSIYDPRADSNRNMMPQIHSDYSRVHTHRARVFGPNYARSDYNPNYQLPPHSFPMNSVTSKPTAAKTEPPLKKVEHKSAAKLNMAKLGSQQNQISARFQSIDPLDESNFDGLQCPPQQSGHFVYIMDCRQFLNCWKGRGYIQSCAPGTVFNPDTRQCDHPSKVSCVTSHTMDTYQNLRRARKPRDPNVAQNYESFNSPARIKCPPGVIGLLEHPTDCRKFLNCNNGATVVQDCGPGTAFNPRMSVCDHIHNVDCNRYGNLVDVGPIRQPNPPVQQTGRETGQPNAAAVEEEDDVETATYDIDVRLSFDQVNEPAAVNEQIPRPQVKQRSSASEIRPVYVAPPAGTITSTTPRMNQANTRYNPTYYRANVTPDPQSLHSNPSDLPISEALKVLLRPYLADKDVDINMTKIQSMMEQTTTVKINPANRYNPAELDDLGEQSQPLTYVPRQPPYFGMPTQRPPVQQNVQALHRPRATTAVPAIRSRFGGEQPSARRNPCQGKFLCGNGRCVDSSKVCDGKTDCETGADEASCAHVGYEIRLSGTHQGSIEVKAFGRWGYVCDDNFDKNAADVVCRELGFEGGVAELKPHSFYHANGTTPTAKSAVFIMDEVRCRGNESTLRECAFAGWGVHDCNDEEVMGLVCKTPVMTCPSDYWLCDASSECVPIGFLCDNVVDCADGSDEHQQHCNAPLEMRLVDGPSKSEGRVEVKYRGIWGTICDDDFGVREARVVCRQLGLNGTGEVRKNKYRSGTGQIWLDQVVCNGNETSIDDCLHWHWGEHNCGHGEDVGVSCGAPAARSTLTSNRSGGKSMKLDFIEKSTKIYPDSCGQLQVDPKAVKPTYGARVVHGGETVYGHHPWQAALRVKKQGKSVHWCGAVLISKYHVLTAAHCLIGYPKGGYMIRLGDFDTQTLEQAELDIFIEDYYIHEDFRKGHHMNNDIAVVLLKSPIRFNKFIQPICLPTKNQAYPAGMNCTISGWGAIESGSSVYSQELKAATVPLLSTSVCTQPEVYGSNITETMFCAGNLAGGTDACDGDSGGPLVCTDKQRGHTLYGIISWGAHCGYANKPGVYVKVKHYLDWIEQKLNQSMHAYGV